MCKDAKIKELEERVSKLELEKIEDLKENNEKLKKELEDLQKKYRAIFDTLIWCLAFANANKGTLNCTNCDFLKHNHL